MTLENEEGEKLIEPVGPERLKIIQRLGKKQSSKKSQKKSSESPAVQKKAMNKQNSIKRDVVVKSRAQ